jgi:DNA-binding transcriptional MerR regulator
MSSTWTVKEVAEMSGVTVRTLHYYDEIGLLRPADRSASGYRRYSEVELERLHEILLYRELGLALEDIGAVLDAPMENRERMLREHRSTLVARRRRTEAVIRAVDRALTAMERDESLSTEDLMDGFKDLKNAPEHIRTHQAEHAEETAERWGDTDAYRTSARRVKNYTKEDWENINLENERTLTAMSRLLREGADPEGEAAMDGAEAMRMHIDRWYYPCSRFQHAALADMYEADPRFKATYEEKAEGLAGFVAAAIRANALRVAGEQGR